MVKVGKRTRPGTPLPGQMGLVLGQKVSLGGKNKDPVSAIAGLGGMDCGLWTGLWMLTGRGIVENFTHTSCCSSVFTIGYQSFGKM